MNVIILAAGKGERLRPLTNDKPKCMVELFGKSILEWQIEKFQKFGITDITIITGYNSESIVYPQFNLVKNPKFDSTNMVETLFCAENEMDEQIIISYGDIIFEKKVLTSLINSDEDYSVVIDKNWRKYWESRFTDPLIDAESLILDSMNNIIEIGQTTKNIDDIQGQYIGLMKFQGSGLKFLRNFYQKTKEEAKKTGENSLNSNIDFKKSYMTDFIQGLINAGCKIKAISINNGWLELDNNDDYKIYNKMYEDGKLSEFIELKNKN